VPELELDRAGNYDPPLRLAFRLARLFGMGIEEIFEEG